MQPPLGSRRKRRSKRRRRWCPLFYVPLIAGFLCVSGALFMSLEYAHSEEAVRMHESACEEERSFVIAILNSTDINDTANVSSITTAVEALDNTSGPGPPPLMTFMNGLVYTASIFTTLGYGELVARTASGRFVTALVALLGIPLYISFTSDLAETLADLIFTSTRTVKHRFTQKRGAKTSKVAVFMIMLVISFLYICCMSAVLMLAEPLWTYLEAAHFLFQSMTLVGFGDLIADHQLFVYVHLPIIVFGQTLLAMTFYMITKFFRFILPRRFSICCLNMLDFMAGNSSEGTMHGGRSDESVQLEPNNAMCLHMPSEDESEEAPISNQAKKPLMSTIKKTIEEVLPWSEDSAPIETSSRTVSPYAPYRHNSNNFAR